VQSFPVPVEFSKMLHFGIQDFLWQTTEFSKDAQLQFLRHFRQFGGAGGVEDYLKLHLVVSFGSAYGNRTRLSALRGPCPN
jgi:hypothetical protein